MDIDGLQIVFRWLHIGAVVVAIGGAFFTVVILRPAARKTLSDADHDQLRGAILQRWRMVVHVCIAVILISGLAGIYYAMKTPELSPAYHYLLGVKVLAALGIFFLASALVGRSSAFEPLRQRMDKWLGLLLLLAGGAIVLAAMLNALRTS